MEDKTLFLNKKRGISTDSIDDYEISILKSKTFEIKDDSEISILKSKILEIKDDFDFVSAENKRLNEEIQNLQQKNSKLKYVTSKLNYEKDELKDIIENLNMKLKTNVDGVIDSKTNYFFQSFIDNEKKREEKVKILREKLKKSIQITKNLIESQKLELELVEPLNDEIELALESFEKN